MTPFDVASIGTASLLIGGAGLAGLVATLRNLAHRRPVLESVAATQMAAGLGLTPLPLEGAELAGLAAAAVLEAEAPVSLAVRWRAPDATFTAFVVAQRRTREGVVIVTPHNERTERPRLAHYARIASRKLEPVPLPSRLRVDLPGVSAHRLGERLIVRRPGVEDGDALERLVMLACALLDAE